MLPLACRTTERTRRLCERRGFLLRRRLPGGGTGRGGGEGQRTRRQLPGSDAYENLQFYYHADHLGSTSYITNLDGEWCSTWSTYRSAKYSLKSGTTHGIRRTSSTPRSSTRRPDCTTTVRGTMTQG